MAAPAFAPPHPMAKFRVLKQAWREYLASGNALGADINTVPNIAVTAPLTVGGVIYKDQSAPQFPPQVSVRLYIGANLEAARNTPVAPVTGVYTTTFPASTLPAGTYQATVIAPPVLAPQLSNTFTVT